VFLFGSSTHILDLTDYTSRQVPHYRDLVTPNFTISSIDVFNGGPSSTASSVNVIVNGILNSIACAAANVVINSGWSPPQEGGTSVVPGVAHHDVLGHAGVELVPIHVDQSEQIDLRQEHRD
jgi:hypothetical protein